MEYKSNDINDLSQELKERIVTFEYKKLDGSVRTATGTMMESYIPEKLPDIIYLDREAVDALMEAKNIKTLEEYAKENGLEYMLLSSHPETNKTVYVFVPAREKRKLSEETLASLMTYYDVEKDAFRSFKKDNFLGIVK